jgi:hypothetical protein
MRSAEGSNNESIVSIPLSDSQILHSAIITAFTFSFTMSSNERARHDNSMPPSTRYALFYAFVACFIIPMLKIDLAHFYRSHFIRRIWQVDRDRRVALAENSLKTTTWRSTDPCRPL